MDAYTLRKIAPRILLAVIGINLSIYLCIAAIDVTNIIGDGVGALIMEPFDTDKLINHVKGDVSNTIGMGVLAAIGVIGGAVWAALAGIGSIFTILGIGALLGFVILLVLAFRQALLILLTILSPVAIALFILPGTEKYFRQWWDLFVKALLVYPIVAALFAISNVMVSIVIDKAARSGSILDLILALIFAFAPLFLIPFSFRFAGGAMSTIMNTAGSPIRRMSESARRRRQKVMGERLERAQSNSLWDPNHPIGRRANTAMSWATSPGSNLAYKARNRRFSPFSNKTGIPGMRKKGHAVASGVNERRLEHSMNALKKLNEGGMFNDKSYRALAGLYDGLSDETQTALRSAGFIDDGGNSRAPRSLDEIKTMAGILSSSGSDTERIAGGALQGSMGTLATMYSSPDSFKADSRAVGLMGLASHGFASDKDIAKAANAMAGDSGEDFDFAQRAGIRASVLGQQQRPDVKAGYGLLVNPDGKSFRAVTEDPGRTRALLGTIKQADWLGAKSPALKNLAPHIKEYATRTGSVGAGVSEAEAAAMMEHIALGASRYSSSDISAKAEWKQLAHDLQLDQQVARLEAEQQRMEEEGRLGGPPAPGGEGGEGGGEGGE